MSITVFRNNAATTARSAFQVSQAIAFNTITAAVITADRTRAAWSATAHHRRIAAILARATYAGIRAAAPHAGRAVLHLIAVVISIAVLAYRRGRQFRDWLNALVAECEAESPAMPTIEPEPEIESITQPEPEPIAQPEIEEIAPQPELQPQSDPQPEFMIDLINSMTRDELRRECRRQGINWRDAKGKNRHLTVTEMKEAIAAI
jgi:hypothetical protein